MAKPPPTTPSFVGTDLTAARFVDTNLAGAHFREAFMPGVTMTGVVLTDAVVDGLVQNLTVNGVEGTGFVAAELDRRHPVRPLLRSADREELARGWQQLCAAWVATRERLEALRDGQEHVQVDGEWSAVETLRHLVFVHDSWFDHAVRGTPAPFQPFGLAPNFVPERLAMGLDPAARPSLAEVLAVRVEQQSRFTVFLDAVTPEVLTRSGVAAVGPGWPTEPEDHTVLDCVHVVLEEEWAHHQYCLRDLDRV